MKKQIISRILAAACICAMMTSGGTSAVLAAEGTDPVQTQSQDTAESMVTSYLTGEPIRESAGRRRPVAVMLNNIQEGCPQSGISKAGVVYEVPVEGNITRLMGIFEDYDDLDKIGSVRSCRDYYIYYAKEFDAIYAHYGQAVYANNYFDQNLIDHLNGLSSVGSTVYYRTTDRVAPHNAYTSYQGIQAGIEASGFSQEYDPSYAGHYQFAGDGEEIILGGQAASTVSLNCFSVNNPWFTYDENTKKYNRFQYGEAQVDDVNNEALSCDNIILQYSPYSYYDENGYLNIDTVSGGEGKFITRGQAIDITWSKNEPWGVTHYYDSNGQEIRLNQGKTWVEIILNDRVGEVTIQ